jgi:cytochrome c biogenesis protein CcdA/thiol-disulfide isomerase/thioredoxin
MLLIAIAFLAGVVTAVSPCVLPVLPIVLAGGATGTERRPYAIIAGLTASFAVFTLFAAWLLDAIGLPKDTLRNVAIAMLFLLSVTLIVPRVGELVERPFAVLTRRPGGDLGGGFLLGASLGLVFVPCAGPVLAFITASAASLDFGVEVLLVTVAYALGAALPMLAIALGGNRAVARSRRLRQHAAELRVALGVVMAAAAFGIVFHVDEKAQRALGDYTGWIQDRFENTERTRRAIANARSATGSVAQAAVKAPIEDYGPAPELGGISHWLNTPGDRPLTLAGLRGKVVLVDFWTYSCINCLRTLSHLRAWNHTYARSGLVIVGLHTPEFAFEHELGNVRRAVKRLDVDWPVALDNSFTTWNRFQNQYWPAKYLLDARGHLRYAHFGEGEYERTERLIRALLLERGATLPRPVDVPDETPDGRRLTPESYLGYSRLERFTGSPVRVDRFADYRFPTVLPEHGLGYAGRWRVEGERIVAGLGARLELAFRARNIYLVIGGRPGTVDVRVNGRHVRTVKVRGIARLYPLASFPKVRGGVLELRFSPGVAGYAFTFG